MTRTEELEARQQKMISMYEKGLSMAEIAAHFEIREQSARNRLAIYRKKGLVGKRIRERKPRQETGSRERPRPFRRVKEKKAISEKLLAETRCSCCGKIFYRTAEWVYKKRSGKGKLYYCSWGCQRKSERQKEEKTAKAG